MTLKVSPTLGANPRCEGDVLIEKNLDAIDLNVSVRN